MQGATVLADAPRMRSDGDPFGGVKQSGRWREGYSYGVGGFLVIKYLRPDAMRSS
ncbi:hypothetical protein [Paracidovorax cattleyae]|uniref:Aldehyde dehydrogenase family protein n=1 Tax=Paracidovorax cattleyae TaxID=80868 RepID=A0A1H0LC40_9BURK|nr:hypothetical protein [Paracidovorax cattleyae]SDO65794.1 hypothetical protein SAMN04489708_102139 [Paracidovorax cattleyae]